MMKDREAWHAAVHGVAKSWMRLSNWTTTINYLHIIYIVLGIIWNLELIWSVWEGVHRLYAHATPFYGLPWWLRWWRIRLQCRRPGFDPWVGKILWKREWQPPPVFLPGEFSWTEEPCRPQSLGSQRVGHDWVTKHPILYDGLEHLQNLICTGSHGSSVLQYWGAFRLFPIFVLLWMKLLWTFLFIPSGGQWALISVECIPRSGFFGC